MIQKPSKLHGRFIFKKEIKQHQNDNKNEKEGSKINLSFYIIRICY